MQKKIINQRIWLLKACENYTRSKQRVVKGGEGTVYKYFVLFSHEICHEKFSDRKQEAKKKKSRTVPKIKSQHRMAARERSLMQTPSAGMTINRILLINPTKNTKFAHAVLGCARKYTRIRHCGRSADMQQALAHKQQEGGSEKRELIISLILAAASHLSR